MIYGYARVSTTTQGRDGNSLEDQVTALEKYGCQEIVKEAFTGKTMERPKFLSLLEQLEEGDTLVVCKLDRFARTAIEGVQTVRELFERGIRVHILNMGLVGNTLTGNLILTVMLAFAEYERGMIVERTQTGKAVARQDLSADHHHDWYQQKHVDSCEKRGIRERLENNSPAFLYVRNPYRFLCLYSTGVIPVWLRNRR